MRVRAVSMLSVALSLLGGATAFATITDDARAQAVQSPQWQALLHMHNGQSQITDPAYFMAPSGQHDALAELNATIQALQQPATSPNQAAACRFPARARFIRRQLPQLSSTFQAALCPDLTEYRQQVPLTSVTLVFAAEDATRPTSAMGHLFLKLSGRNLQGQPASHALSFFTDLSKARNSNTAAFVVGSLFTGTDGLFILNPYRERRDDYLINQQRNLWEYPLPLTAVQQANLHDHIWEMRGINVAYNFQSNNCASAVMALLKAADPALGSALYKPFITPADLLRTLHHQHRLGSPTIQLSEPARHRRHMQHLPVMPVNTPVMQPPAASLQTSLVGGNDGTYMHVNILPAYHRWLSAGGDRQEYAAELFKLGLNVNDETVHINTLTLLSMRALLPSTRQAPVWSSALTAGFDNNGFGMQTGGIHPRLLGGIGMTFDTRAESPLSFSADGYYPYLMLNAGYAWYQGHQVISLVPEAGLVVRHGDPDLPWGKTDAGVMQYVSSADDKYRTRARLRHTTFLFDRLNLNLELATSTDTHNNRHTEASFGLTVFY